MPVLPVRHAAASTSNTGALPENWRLRAKLTHLYSRGSLASATEIAFHERNTRRTVSDASSSDVRTIAT